MYAMGSVKIDMTFIDSNAHYHVQWACVRVCCVQIKHNHSVLFSLFNFCVCNDLQFHAVYIRRACGVHFQLGSPPPSSPHPHLLLLSPRTYSLAPFSHRGRIGVTRASIFKWESHHFCFSARTRKDTLPPSFTYYPYHFKQLLTESDKSQSLK